uniref:Uncharacterized protein n=1 Tax=Solanum lycopersicum TaxID=4081 RepID=A0A3Q7HNB9_SOLLC
MCASGESNPVVELKILNKNKAQVNPHLKSVTTSRQRTIFIVVSRQATRPHTLRGIFVNLVLMLAALCVVPYCKLSLLQGMFREGEELTEINPK